VSAAKQDLVVALGMIMKDLTPMLLFYGVIKSGKPFDLKKAMPTS